MHKCVLGQCVALMSERCVVVFVVADAVRSGGERVPGRAHSLPSRLPGPHVRQQQRPGTGLSAPLHVYSSELCVLTLGVLYGYIMCVTSGVMCSAGDSMCV